MLVVVGKEFQFGAAPVVFCVPCALVAPGTVWPGRTASAFGLVSGKYCFGLLRFGVAPEFAVAAAEAACDDV